VAWPLHNGLVGHIGDIVGLLSEIYAIFTLNLDLSANNSLACHLGA